MLANMDGLHLEALSPAEAADLRRGAALAAACLRSLRVAPGDMEMLARVRAICPLRAHVRARAALTCCATAAPVPRL